MASKVPKRGDKQVKNLKPKALSRRSAARITGGKGTHYPEVVIEMWRSSSNDNMTLCRGKKPATNAKDLTPKSTLRGGKKIA